MMVGREIVPPGPPALRPSPVKARCLLEIYLWKEIIRENSRARPGSKWVPASARIWFRASGMENRGR